jgi:signal transduction histidine kinase
MKVSLPNMLSSFDGFNALSNLADAATGLTRGTLDVSLAALSVVDPNMAAPLGAVLNTIRDRSNTISIVDVPSLPLAVLEKNGFLRCFGYPDTAPWSNTAVPYTRFSAKEIKLFYDFLDLHLPSKGLPDMTGDFALQFLQILGEVFINAETHADSSLGVFVCGQFYPNQQRLVLSIADSGVTIPERVNQRFNINLPAIRALRWALVEGNTTKRDTPGGVGLKLLRDFICANRGQVQIASGQAFWQFHAEAEEFKEFDHVLPATVVTVVVDTANWQFSDSPTLNT